MSMVSAEYPRLVVGDPLDDYSGDSRHDGQKTVPVPILFGTIVARAMGRSK